MPVTYDESEFNVQTVDAAHVETPVGNLRVMREGPDVRLAWEGGSPPYRVFRSDTPDPADRRLLASCCMERSYVDRLVAGDETNYYYTVE
jgi:hypothetical protein